MFSIHLLLIISDKPSNVQRFKHSFLLRIFIWLQKNFLLTTFRILFAVFDLARSFVVVVVLLMLFLLGNSPKQVMPEGTIWTDLNCGFPDRHLPNLHHVVVYN